MWHLRHNPSTQDLAAIWPQTYICLLKQLTDNLRWLERGHDLAACLETTCMAQLTPFPFMKARAAVPPGISEDEDAQTLCLPSQKLPLSHAWRTPGVLRTTYQEINLITDVGGTTSFKSTTGLKIFPHKMPAVSFSPLAAQLKPDYKYIIFL